MGCDIHLYVEVDKGNGWELSTAHIRNERYGTGRDWYGTIMVTQRSVPELNDGERISGVFYTRRDYRLFAALAGARNSWGIVPIAPPRGLPRDVCDEVRVEADRWGTDGHSHSWLTVEELLGYEWPKSMNRLFIDTTLPLLRAVGDPVRIVFWFDN